MKRVEDDFWTTLEDWFSRGKEDAWCRRPKLAPEQAPEAASLYDLGYDEGLLTQLPQVNVEPSTGLLKC